MFCITCGKEITNDSSFCPFCGQQLIFSSTIDTTSLQNQLSESKNLLNLLRHAKTLVTQNKELELLSDELKIELGLYEQIKNKEIVSKKADTFNTWAVGLSFFVAFVFSVYRFAATPGWNGLISNFLTLLIAGAMVFLITAIGMKTSEKLFPLSDAGRLQRETEIALEAQTYYDEKCVPVIRNQELATQQRQFLENKLPYSQLQNYIPQIYLEDVSALDSLIFYFEQKRVSTLKEAFNLYETEKIKKQTDEQNKAMQNDSSIKCPKCGSSSVDSITKSHSSNTSSAMEGCCCATILIPFIGWFAIPIGLCCGSSGTKTTSTESYCQGKSCGTKFQKK